MVVRTGLRRWQKGAVIGGLAGALSLLLDRFGLPGDALGFRGHPLWALTGAFVAALPVGLGVIRLWHSRRGQDAPPADLAAADLWPLGGARMWREAADRFGLRLADGTVLRFAPDDIAGAVLRHGARDAEGDVDEILIRLDLTLAGEPPFRLRLGRGDATRAGALLAAGRALLGDRLALDDTLHRKATARR